MLTDIERNLLVRAREIVAASDGGVRICTALIRALGKEYRDQDADAVFALRQSIHRALNGYAYLPSWIANKTGESALFVLVSKQKLRNTRLAWIDHMLESW